MTLIDKIAQKRVEDYDLKIEQQKQLLSHMSNEYSLEYKVIQRVIEILENR